MNIEEIRTVKKCLENEIGLAVSKLVDRFTKETNMGICEIYIPMLDVTNLGDTVRKYVVGKVTTEVERI